MKTGEKGAKGCAGCEELHHHYVSDSGATSLSEAANALDLGRGASTERPIPLEEWAVEKLTGEERAHELE